MTGTVPDGLFLWGGTVRTKGFRERVAAARAGGFSEMSMSPLDYRNFTRGGLDAKEMRSIMDEGGVRVTTLDPLTKWLPRWEPPAGIARQRREFLGFDEPEFFRIAEELAVDSIITIQPFDDEVPIDDAAESFARVCDRAAGHGLRVGLEFTAPGAIRDLATAWEIVRRANRANGGLDFDTWHYFRGQPDDELLATIPGEKIFFVELADARAGVRGSSLEEDLFHHRLPPGEGDFDLIPLLRLLDGIGGLSSVGIEMFSDEFDSLPPGEAGRRAGSSMRALLARANVRATKGGA